MIIKGGARAGAGSLAVHVLRTDTNENVNLKECRGVLAQDVAGALQEMEAIASGSRCNKFLYHAHIDPRADEFLTPEQWEKAVDTLEKNLGLDGHQRVVIEHVKNGRQHQHVIWNRVDVENLRSVSDSNNYEKHETTSRQLEREFGLQSVQGVHHREAETARPERTPEQWEFQQSLRTELDPRQIKREVKSLYRESGSGQEFAAALDEHGYELAKGDRRDFVLVDEAGGVHSLARMAGVKVADLREKMADINREQLPTVEEAREQQINRAADRQQEQPQAEAKNDRQEVAARFEKSDREVTGRQMDGPRVSAAPVLGAVAKTADSALKMVDSVLDFFVGPPPRKISPQELFRSVEARQERAAQLAAEARREQALENLHDDWQSGRGLAGEDLKNLSRHDLEEIKAHGIDDGLKLLIEDLEREQGRGRQRERER